MRHYGPTRLATLGPVRPTRFPELAYQEQGARNWRFLSMDGERPVGPSYPTRTALLDDFERYAEAYGCR